MKFLLSSPLPESAVAPVTKTTINGKKTKNIKITNGKKRPLTLHNANLFIQNRIDFLSKLAIDDIVVV